MGIGETSVSQNTVSYNSWASLGSPQVTLVGIWGVLQLFVHIHQGDAGLIQIPQRLHPGPSGGCSLLGSVFAGPTTPSLGPILTFLLHALPK